ncbi:hypothetical protein DERF_001090 [Dermatophagoides farinae]|uniref:Uncharacterized protein n=1 Tax=Dermatophagoides farinae TaxID=6954 RepID=A0A922IA54_DERFA|nr:hypothetical protein DERF_001090 [Dermatophagoides farinae]
MANNHSFACQLSTINQDIGNLNKNSKMVRFVHHLNATDLLDDTEKSIFGPNLMIDEKIIIFLICITLFILSNDDYCRRCNNQPSDHQKKVNNNQQKRKETSI